MAERSLSHYRLIRKIGEGGMGEVHLAEDTSLKRDVAVKLLPASVRDDPERLRRFRTEAEAAAKLNHPNVATVHSIEEASGEIFITMEYVDGSPLSAHIGDGGLEPDRFLEWFLLLSDALAHAHEQGLVHRDLKPANIVIRADGTPKILDFGLARIVSGEAAEPGADSEAPTQHVEASERNPPSLTAAGALLGTPAYMSPEQIEGKRVDARTDLFSMGVVMYEALAGRRPFAGSTVESIIARILEVEPEPITAVKPLTPYSLWSTVRRCLKKDRELRLPTARLLHEELRDVQRELEAGTVLVDASAASRGEAGTARWRPSIVAGVAVLALAIGAIAGRFLAPDTAAPPLRKWQIDVQLIGGISFGDVPKISPDGTKLAYIDRSRLWIRDFDELAPREVPGGDGASYLFWSPASDRIGYFNEEGLHAVSVSDASGTAVRLAERALSRGSGGGGVFREDGSVLIATGGREGLLVVPAGGGAPRTFVEPDIDRGERDFHQPFQLPGGELLVVVHTEVGIGEIGLVAASGARQTLLDFPGEFVSQPVYAAPGYLVFERSGEIWGAPFSLTKLAIDGTPFRIVPGARAPSVSEDGTLVYLQGSADFQLAWVDRDGRLVREISERHTQLGSPVASPNGERVAVIGVMTARDTVDLWVYESRGARIRLTDDTVLDREPAWPDANRISLNREGTIYLLPADEPGRTPEPLTSGGNPSWSGDGR